MSARLFIRDLTILDYAYLDPEIGPRGDSLYVSIELEGDLDACGFLYDFGPAKKQIKALIDEQFDHSFLTPSTLGKSWQTTKGEEYFYQAPSSATHLLTHKISDLALEVENAVTKILPPNVKKASVRLREDPRFTSEANYRYTHGLRFHNGNCQRLIHGHRNTIEVWQKGNRLSDWEKKLAGHWQDAHFAAAETVTNRAELDLPIGKRFLQHPDLAEIAYSAPQGNFLYRFPAHRLVILSSEPSIENMTDLALTTLKEWGLTDFEVVAYEGLNKGALARSNY